MNARVGVITFPGTLDDQDAARAIEYSGATPVALWHNDDTLQAVDAVVIPGGFSYGDYLRAGAIASLSPIMTEVISAAQKGLPVLGICNGFQILCEAGLLPGIVTRNKGLHFICKDQWLIVENSTSSWTGRFESQAEILIPIKHAEGRYIADSATITELERAGRVAFRYRGENPNGSINDIAGISSENGKIVGLMPHPEHAIDSLTGPSDDGLGLFLSVLDSLIVV